MIKKGFFYVQTFSQIAVCIHIIVVMLKNFKYERIL